MTSRVRLRRVIESDDLTVAPGVYDGISARLVEQLGFETAIITGAGVSNSRLGQPDFGILNLSENAAQSGMIADTVGIPVQADADTGYGNAVSVYNAVRAFENMGVAAVMIEDQEAPKRCGHMEGKAVISMEEMCQKVSAAVEARDDTDPDLLIKARTDATKTEGIDEAVRRLNAYSEMGADLVFADALRSAENIEYVAEHVDAPLAVNMGFGIRERPTTPLLSPSKLAALGADMVSYPRLITAAAAQGMETALRTLQESVETGEVREEPDQVFGWEALMELMGQPELRDREQRYAAVDPPATDD